MIDLKDFQSFNQGFCNERNIITGHFEQIGNSLVGLGRRFDLGNNLFRFDCLNGDILYELKLYLGNQKFSYILHREDGPAKISSEGIVQYYQYNVLHRVNGPASIDIEGNESYYQYGVLHRLDGPAITGDRTEYWIYGFQVKYQEDITYIQNMIILD